MVLDPLEKIPDSDRLDNVFIQYAEFSDSVDLSPSCDVVALGLSHGEPRNPDWLLTLSSRKESSHHFQ